MLILVHPLARQKSRLRSHAKQLHPHLNESSTPRWASAGLLLGTVKDAAPFTLFTLFFSGIAACYTFILAATESRYLLQTTIGR